MKPSPAVFLQGHVSNMRKTQKQNAEKAAFAALRMIRRESAKKFRQKLLPAYDKSSARNISGRGFVDILFQHLRVKASRSAPFLCKSWLRPCKYIRRPQDFRIP